MLDDFEEGDLCINVLPPDDILRQYHVEPRREALVLSRQSSENGSADSIAALSRQLEQNAHLGCDDAHNLPALVPPPPIDPSHAIQLLNIHDRVDVRDLVSGKWRPAEVGVFFSLIRPNSLESLTIDFARLLSISPNFQVQGIVQSTVFLRYFARGAQDESSVDEKIDAAIEDNRARFAQYKSLCEGTIN